MKRVLISAVTTMVILWNLYRWRTATFLIWTDAAIINHTHPLVTVACIEVVVAATIFFAVFAFFRLGEKL